MASALRPAPRSITAGLVVALVLLVAEPASAVDRREAVGKAVAALGAEHARTPVVVFALPKPLRVGSRVTVSGSRRPVAVVRRERAFFLYQDGAPSRPYPHAGRVALVGVRSGRVTLSRTIMRRPLVNGRLPAFLRSRRAYRSSRYRVFDGSSRDGDPSQDSTTAATPPGLLDPLAPTTLGQRPNMPPKADNQVASVKEGVPKAITLTGSDDDGDLLTFHITKQPLRGTLSGQPPEVVYTPPPGFRGPDHFTFKVSDGDAESNAAQVSIDVVPLGQAPVVTTSAGCTAYTEQAPAVAVDGQLTVSDPDDGVLDSARVRIATGHQGGDDLLFTDQNGITGSYNDNTGVLSLGGTSSVANYQAALASVRYRNLASGNATATKDVEFVVSDGGNESTPAVKQVCVTGGAGGDNDPPTGETGEGGLSYIENDGPVPVDSAFVVGDQDSANLSGATVKFVPLVTQPVDEEGEPSGPPITTITFAPAEDELAFVDQNGISGSYDSATGLLTLSGSASVADYETAIRSVTYENTSEDPSDLTRRVQFQLTDSSGANSTPTRRDVFVTPVNDAPEVDPSAGSTDYTGSATTVDGALAAIDVDDDDLEGATVAIASGFAAGDELVFVDQLGITGSYDSATGVLTLAGTAPVADYETALRSVAFDHTAGTPSGDRSIAFTTNDGELDSAPAAKHVEVNDPPVLDASDASLAYTENDGPVAADAGITVTDADSPTLGGATVAISAGFAAGEDELAFTDQNGISGSYDDTTGVLTLSGSASVADYEAALRSVTYENASDDPSTARTLTFGADDGAVFNSAGAAVTRDVAITPVNDAPEVTTSAGSTAYTEGDAATAVDSALTVSDADDASLESAAVTIASGFQSADELVFADQAGIVGAYDSSTGVLTLTGTATVADYEAALRSVEYRHGGDDPSATKTVEITVSDGEADSAAATKEVAVTPVADAPVLDTTDDALAYSEGDGPVAVDPGITATDVDSVQLAGATVTISAGFAEAEDELAFADQNGITGSYDDTTGVLTLSGAASVADYEAALRSVTYENVSGDPTAARTISFAATDGEAASDPATREVAISGDNVAPVVTTSAGTTSYVIGDPATPIDPALTVSDADDANLEGATVRIASGAETGDELTFTDQNGISGTFDSENGVLTLAGAATVADYEAALRSVGYAYTGTSLSGSRTIEFKANDGSDDSAPATKAVDVAAPVA